MAKCKALTGSAVKGLMILTQYQEVKSKISCRYQPELKKAIGQLDLADHFQRFI